MSNPEQDRPGQRPRRTVIIGAGRMGVAIADHFLRKGVQIVLCSRRTGSNEQIERKLAPAIRRGRFTPDAGGEPLIICRNVGDTTLREVDLIVEAIEEHQDNKVRLLSTLRQFADEGHIISTNTSSLDIEQLDHEAGLGGRLIGTHFFYPVALMPIVEIAAPVKAEWAGRRAGEMMAALGLKPVTVRNSPGFFVNRILVKAFLAACEINEQKGCSYGAIDRAFVAAGAFIGPFSAVDRLGLDVTLAVLASMQKHHDGFLVPPVLEQKVKDNKLGMRTSEGFFSYVEGLQMNSPVNAADKQRIEIVEALVRAIERETHRCIEESIVDRESLPDAMMAVLGSLGAKIADKMTTGQRRQIN